MLANMENKSKQVQDFVKLERWFSEPRLERYSSFHNPAAFYVWNERLSKAYPEEIAYVEVLLRNFISVQLSADCNRELNDVRWFDHADFYNLSSSFSYSVEKAKRRLRAEGKETSYDNVIAALSFDVWRFLLVSRLEPTVWRALRKVKNGGMPNYSGTSRKDFEAHVGIVYELRNRCSHQEPLIMRNPEAEAARLTRYSRVLRWVAEKIDPEAAEWIHANSRVDDIRSQRPLEF